MVNTKLSETSFFSVSSFFALRNIKDNKEGSKYFPINLGLASRMPRADNLIGFPFFKPKIDWNILGL